MNCEKCGKNKATVFYKENINGHIRTLNLCARCTELMKQAGELEDFSSAFSNFLSPFSFFEEGDTDGFLSIRPEEAGSGASIPAACPQCGSTLHDIAVTGRIGCAGCYRVFGPALQGTLASLHGQAVHIGRVPRGYRLKKEKLKQINALKAALKQAVAREDYEEAASLRDRIRGLEA